MRYERDREGDRATSSVACTLFYSSYSFGMSSNALCFYYLILFALFAIFITKKSLVLCFPGTLFVFFLFYFLFFFIVLSHGHDEKIVFLRSRKWNHKNQTWFLIHIYSVALARSLSAFRPDEKAALRQNHTTKKSIEFYLLSKWIFRIGASIFTELAFIRYSSSLNKFFESVCVDCESCFISPTATIRNPFIHCKHVTVHTVTNHKFFVIVAAVHSTLSMVDSIPTGSFFFLHLFFYHYYLNVWS